MPESQMAALLGEAALLVRGHECDFPQVAPTRFLTALFFRDADLAQTALWGNPSQCTMDPRFRSKVGSDMRFWEFCSIRGSVFPGPTSFAFTFRRAPSGDHRKEAANNNRDLPPHLERDKFLSRIFVFFLGVPQQRALRGEH